MFDNLTFEYPYFILFYTLFILCSIYCKEKSPTLYFVNLTMFKNSTNTLNLFLPILKHLIIIFSLIALSSPVKVLDSKLLKKDGINIILNLDTSGSMKQMGFNPNNLRQNRWEIVSLVVQDFIDKRVNDNIGVVVFGTDVLTASPLSFDKDAQKEIVKYLNIGVVGEKTAMIDSIATSINILKDSKSKSKIIILLTDGEDTASKIPAKVVINLALKYNIKVYTIGIGESNKFLLDKISNETKAKSFYANSLDSLVEVYEVINKIEKSEIEDNKIILKDYLFFYPLFL